MSNSFEFNFSKLNNIMKKENFSIITLFTTVRTYLKYTINSK